MNVDELQLHLSNLGQLLRNAGGRKIADDLADLCQRLQPYRDRPLKGFMDLVDKADEIVRTGTPPTRTKARTPKTDPQITEKVCNQIVDFYQRAKESDLTREQIERAFSDLEKLDLTVAQLQSLAGRMDVSQKFRAKKALLEAMKRAILERKGAFQRVQV